MSTYLIRRLLGLIPLLFGIALASFCFMQAMPGGPTALLARNPHMTPAELAIIKHNFGLDQPWYVQFWDWLNNLIHGNLGTSYVQYRPVTQVIGERIPNTFQLVIVAMVIALVIAAVAGILSAV